MDSMRRLSKLSRRPGTRTPAARIVIVTEGQRTEPEYLKNFAIIHSAKTVEVIPIGIGGEPKAVVRRAIDELRRANKDSLGRRDSVWAVFDRDEHPRFYEAKDLASAHGVRLALSNPCFELWGIFHYRDWDASVDRHECQRILEEYCSTYSASGSKLFIDQEAIRKNHPSAVERGKRSLIRRREEGNPEGNPSTAMHLLTKHIEQASKPS